MAAGESGMCGRPRGQRVMNVDEYIGADSLRAPLPPSRIIFRSTRSDRFRTLRGSRGVPPGNFIIPTIMCCV